MNEATIKECDNAGHYYTTSGMMAQRNMICLVAVSSLGKRLMLLTHA